MNNDWVKNIADMHAKYGVNKIVDEFDEDKLKKYLEFRILCNVRATEKNLKIIRRLTDNERTIVNSFNTHFEPKLN